jgi:D-serine deaminase-like pyridoxal phosphate-dependent protein
MAQAVATRELLAEDGHNMEILSGASTGTYNIDTNVGELTEIQAGAYGVKTTSTQ